MSGASTCGLIASSVPTCVERRDVRDDRQLLDERRVAPLGLGQRTALSRTSSAEASTCRSSALRARQVLALERVGGGRLVQVPAEGAVDDALRAHAPQQRRERARGQRGQQPLQRAGRGGRPARGRRGRRRSAPAPRRACARPRGRAAARGPPRCRSTAPCGCPRPRAGSSARRCRPRRRPRRRWRRAGGAGTSCPGSARRRPRGGRRGRPSAA